LDLIKAFFWAFKDNPKATLIVKVSSQGISDYFSELHEIIPKLQPFACRFILIDGYLDEASYNELIHHTTFYANSSRSEGLCLPLIEYMSAGKPAIAPRHTAMEDYVTDAGCFVVKSTEELTIWPHDINQKYTAMRNRINWNSLKDAFEESFQVYLNDKDRYETMSRAAMGSTRDYAGMKNAQTSVKAFIQAVLDRNRPAS